MTLSKYFFLFAFAFNILFIPLDKNFYTFTEAKTYIFHIFIIFSFLSLLINQVIREDFSLQRFEYIGVSLKEIIKNPLYSFFFTVILIIFGIICSTILSPIPYVSFFGGSYNRNGYSAYDILTLLTAMCIVPYIFKNILSLRLLLMLIVVMSFFTSIYGLSEIFGVEPIQFVEKQDRVNSTFGNTLSFSSFTAMSIPITLSFLYFKNYSKWYWVTGAGVLLGLQFSSLWLTASRGPWIAVIISMIIFIFLSQKLKLFKNIHNLIPKLLGLIIISSSIILILSFAPKGEIIEGNDPGQISTYRLKRIIPEVVSPNANLTNTNIQGGLTGRLQIWKGTFKLLSSWDTPNTENTVTKLLSPIFGVGPDLFVYSFHFVMEPQTKLINVEHAHSYYLQILIEIGIFNFLLFNILFLIVIFLGLQIIRNQQSQSNKLSLIILTAIMPAVISKLIEMIIGVPRIEDLSTLFILMGSIVALYKINFHKIQHNNKKVTNKSFLFSKLQNFLFVTIISVVLIYTIVHWDLKRIYASRLAAASMKMTDSYDKFHTMKKATELAPLHEKIIRSHAQSISLRAELESEKFNNEEAILWAEMSKSVLEKYENIDPYEWDIQLALAVVVNSLWDLGATEYADEIKQRNLYISNQYPAFPLISSLSSIALAKTGNIYEAEILADKVIEIEQKISFDVLPEKEKEPFSQAWYAKGFIMLKLGYINDSIVAMNTAIEKSPLSESAGHSHYFLSKIYEDEFNDIEKANFHSEESQKIYQNLKDKKNNQ